MNKIEYERFHNAFNLFMQKEGLQNITSDGEPHFSWSPCDCCGTSLGGDRYDASGFNPVDKKVKTGYSICQDCVYYAEYEVLDDATMTEIGEN